MKQNKKYKNNNELTYTNAFNKFKGNTFILIVMCSLLTVLKAFELIMALGSRSNFDSNHHYKNEIWFGSRHKANGATMRKR